MRQLPDLFDFYPPSPPAHAGDERALDRPLSPQENALLTDASRTLRQRGITTGEAIVVYLQHPDFSIGDDRPASSQPAGKEAIGLRRLSYDLANGSRDEQWVRRELYATSHRLSQWLLRKRLN